MGMCGDTKDQCGLLVELSEFDVFLLENSQNSDDEKNRFPCREVAESEKANEETADDEEFHDDEKVHDDDEIHDDEEKHNDDEIADEEKNEERMLESKER
ncbi:hypothetical protein Tco_0462002 [Tanacetum coccineum]